MMARVEEALEKIHGSAKRCSCIYMCRNRCRCRGEFRCRCRCRSK